MHGVLPQIRYSKQKETVFTMKTSTILIFVLGSGEAFLTSAYTINFEDHNFWLYHKPEVP